jgi:ferredoxin
MQEKLRQTARELLAQEKVDVVLGYGPTESGTIGPKFVSEPEEVDQLVWNNECRANLTTYLNRPEIRKLGKPAIVVKGCDLRALHVLESESQVDRDEITVIGMACEGIGVPPQEKCEACDVKMPRGADITIGDIENPELKSQQRYAKLEKLMAMPRRERLEYWKNEFERCFKCYACRQICPMCYCEVCVADKNQPVRFETSATPRGNFAWHINRAFHLAGRCIGCSECARACPAGIDLDLLNLSMAKAAEELFEYRAGKERGAEPLIGSYSESDKEDFIK